MSVMLASTIAVAALNCAGTQTSALLWQEEPSQFLPELKVGDSWASSGPWIWELENNKVSAADDGSQLLTATLEGFPRASFAGRLEPRGSDAVLSWQVTEATAKDGRRTLTSEGKAICKADNQVKAQ